MASRATPVPSNAAPDAEREIVARLIGSAEMAGLYADPAAIVNVYVALKSKPLALLVGAPDSGKITLIRSLGRILTGGNDLGCQMMPGHTWWARPGQPVAFFVEAQTRLNASKILALIEEAWQPENADRLFIACLTRISAAELQGFFSEVAFQLRHGEIMRLPSLHLSEPIPYPPNLRLVGTMDTSRFQWADEDLLATTTVIPWTAEALSSDVSATVSAEVPAPGDAVWKAGLTNEVAVRLKLRRFVRWPSKILQPLGDIRRLLTEHTIPWPRAVTGETLAYLANAWSETGRGLFDLAPARNLVMALDWAILQTVLERLSDRLQASAALRGQLARLLQGYYPRSLTFLENLAPL